MPEPHAAVSIAPYLGMGAAAFGFIGSLVIVLAAWRTIGLRRTIVEAEAVKSNDRTVAQGIMALKHALSKQQLEDLETEHKHYMVGVVLMGVGFILAFVREFM